MYVSFFVCLFIFANALFSLRLINLVFFSQRKTHDNVPISEYVGYALANKGRASDPNNVYNPQDGPDAYTNTAAYEKMSAYATAARTRYGDDFDLTTEPLDTDLLMRMGGGKQHGRYMIAHSAINPATVPTLREVRQGSSSTSDVPIRPRQPSSVQQIAAMQVTTALSIVH